MEYIFKDKNSKYFHISDLTDLYFLEADKLKYQYDADYMSFGKNSFIKVSSNRSEIQKTDLKYKIPTQTDMEFDFIINSINSFFNQLNEPFYLVDLDNRKQIKIDYNGLTEDYSHPMRKELTTITLNFTLLDNFWQSIFLNSLDFLAMGNLDSFTIKISSNVQSIPFKLFITNISSQVNGKFSLDLVNNTIKRGLVISEPGFSNNKTIEIDSSLEDGLIRLLPDDQSIKKSVEVGSPFELYPGENIVTYKTLNSSIVNINLQYYERYLI